jgi:hypothetical protein
MLYYMGFLSGSAMLYRRPLCLASWLYFSDESPPSPPPPCRVPARQMEAGTCLAAARFNKQHPILYCTYATPQLKITQYQRIKTATDFTCGFISGAFHACRVHCSFGEAARLSVLIHCLYCFTILRVLLHNDGS